MASPRADFFRKAPAQARILVLDLGFIGDVVHLVPALHQLRMAHPGWRIDVAVAEQAAPILRLYAVCDRVITYQRFPKARPWYQDIPWILALRREKYDAVINFTGSVRTTILTWLAGAPRRAGSEPPKKRWFWPLFYTDTVAIPHDGMPAYRHHLAVLAALGLADDGHRPVPQIPPEAEAAAQAELGDKAGRFFVFVPYSSEASRDLPDEVMVPLLVSLRERHPDLAPVISSGPNAGERERVRQLLAKMPFQPAGVLDGSLGLAAFIAVLRRAQFYLGTDCGALHLAFIAGVPSFSWFRDAGRKANWLSDLGGSEGLVGRPGATALEGLPAAEVIERVESFIRKLENSPTKKSQPTGAR